MSIESVNKFEVIEESFTDRVILGEYFNAGQNEIARDSNLSQRGFKSGQRRLRTENLFNVSAMAVGNKNLVDVLIKYGNDKYNTPLWKAVEADDFSAVDVLLKNGFNPNELSYNGHVLGMAVQKRSMKMVDLLLNHGANPTVLVDGYNGVSYKHSVLFDLIHWYTLAYVEHHQELGLFAREVIEKLANDQKYTQAVVFECKGKSYTALQVCLSLNNIKDLILNGKNQDLSEIQKIRAAELASIFIKN